MSTAPFPEPLQVYRCCKHCPHTDPHDLPHKEPCDHGCNDEEVPR